MITNQISPKVLSQTVEGFFNHAPYKSPTNFHPLDTSRLNGRRSLEIIEKINLNISARLKKYVHIKRSATNYDGSIINKKTIKYLEESSAKGGKLLEFLFFIPFIPVILCLSPYESVGKPTEKEIEILSYEGSCSKCPVRRREEKEAVVLFLAKKVLFSYRDLGRFIGSYIGYWTGRVILQFCNHVEFHREEILSAKYAIADAERSGSFQDADFLQKELKGLSSFEEDEREVLQLHGQLIERGNTFVDISNSLYNERKRLHNRSFL